jgi:iron-sulfur cluster repair protein YtfE (RIC family)
MDLIPAKDACELLDADHIAVKHLFVDYARLAAAPGLDPAGERHAIAMKICDELTVHAQIEEDIFYPALRQALPEEGDLLEEAQQEHAQAKAKIAQIRALSDAGPELDDLVAQLAADIEHHVKEERDELFPNARAAKGLDLGMLGDQLRDRQHELQTAAQASP